MAGSSVLGCAVVWVGWSVDAPATALWVVVTLVLPYAAAPRLLGRLDAQPYLRLDVAGLHYGPSVLVPWSLITDLGEHRRPFRSPQVVLRSAQWRQDGLAGLFGHRHGLPLSEIDPRWADRPDFVAALSKGLPPTVAAKLPAPG